MAKLFPDLKKSDISMRTFDSPSLFQRRRNGRNVETLCAYIDQYGKSAWRNGLDKWKIANSKNAK